MECFVVGVVATGFFIRTIIKATQSWDGLARNLGYKKIEPFRLEGKHHGLRVVIERIPGQKNGTQTTEVRIKTREGWPSELIIHSQAPRSGLLPFVPYGTMQKIDSALFALRYVVLNVPISKEISNRILGLPSSDLFYASKDEFRFVFTNKSYPSPVEVRKILFQLHTIMKKIKSKEGSNSSSSISSSLVEPPSNNSFVDVDYKGLLNTISNQEPRRVQSLLSSEENVPFLRLEPEEDSLGSEEEDKEIVNNLLDEHQEESVELVMIEAPSMQEESELIDLHKALGEFGVTSQMRETLIKQCSVSKLHVKIETIRPTFELGMPDGYRKGVTVLGSNIDVPVCIYIPQSKKEGWMKRQRGEEYNLSVSVYRYDVLQKQLLFLAT